VDNPLHQQFSLQTVESWNGTSWTEVNDLNTARQEMEVQEHQTNGLVFGGTTGASLAKQNFGMVQVGQN
jgi:hypothetical protein